jgi:hypothetical protein
LLKTDYNKGKKMKKVVYKYPVNAGADSMELPLGAEILKIDSQDGGVFLWALVSPEQVITATVIFDVVVTGQPFHAEDREYVNTFFIDALVFHLFKEV